LVENSLLNLIQRKQEWYIYTRT